MLADVARQVGKHSGVLAPVVGVAPPADLYAVERRNVTVDASRFQSRTGWTPTVALSQGIGRLVSEMRAAAGRGMDRGHTS